jgi:hypothetical protein
MGGKAQVEDYTKKRPVGKHFIDRGARIMKKKALASPSQVVSLIICAGPP